MISQKLFATLGLFLIVVTAKSQGSFNMESDLLLTHYDCKTDVDDLHSIAAFATLVRQSEYKDLNYYAVAGAYGIQGGLYVPPNDLFELAFGDHWTDAHLNVEHALKDVVDIASTYLKSGGDIWIAEAGQSDFSAALVFRLITLFPETDLSKRIHLVQHSNWNQDVTHPVSLSYLQEQIDYQKIPDGNAENNGTPGFRSEDPVNWKNQINDLQVRAIWELAITKGHIYNGIEGRYLNEAIKKGGMDFSDFSEVCWILGLEELQDAEAYFELVSKG